jgi:hypothetical protein
VLLGQATYFALYNPISGDAHWLFTYIPASLAAFTVPALLYWIGMRVLNVRLEALPRDDSRLAKPNI